MNIVINNVQKADYFAAIFQHIKVFTEHINIMFEPERMFVQSMDSARVSVFEIALPSTWFDTYELAEGGSTQTLGLSSSLLYRILSSRDKNQQITIRFDSDEESDKLFVHFTSESKTEFDKNFEIPLIDMDEEILGIPEFETQADFSISSPVFAALVNQLKMFGTNMDVICSEEKIELVSHSIDQGKMMVEIKIDDLTSFAINEGETIKLSFSLVFLHNICLYNKLSKEITVSLSANFPMKIVYILGEDENAKLTFYLAPKISDE